VFKSKI